jgi:hypothetical protein
VEARAGIGEGREVIAGLIVFAIGLLAFHFMAWSQGYDRGFHSGYDCGFDEGWLAGQNKPAPSKEESGG